MQQGQASQQSQSQQQKRSRKKGNDKEDGEWKCLDCCKSYLSYPAFYTHCKTKHDSKWPVYYNTPRPLDEIKRDRGRPRVNNFQKKKKYSNKTNLDEQKQHEREDQIFEFLGKLGQNNEEQEDSQNNCIRHYLKPSIHPVQSLNTEVFKDSIYEQIFKQVLEYLETLNKKVLEQEAIWDFRDPLTLTNELEEFTFSNLKGIFYQLEGQKEINLISVVSIFLGWLSRHLKKKAYQDVTITSIICTYFMKQYKELSKKDLNIKDKLNLMKLEQNELNEKYVLISSPIYLKREQKQDDHSEKQENLGTQEKDIKKELMSQVTEYLVSKNLHFYNNQKKVFHEYEAQISYLKGFDIASAFICLFIEWIEAFADIEPLIGQ